MSAVLCTGATLPHEVVQATSENDSWTGYLGLNMAGALVAAGVLAAAGAALVARRRRSPAG